MFQKTKVGLAAAMLLGGVGLAAGPATAQTSERIEVTGSRILRTAIETASPVQRFSREDLDRAGVASINDLLQRITGAGAGIDDRVTNGFAPGGGGLNLRNLGFNSTLVLINGRRVATYPFGQQLTSGTQGFNDLQNIPLAAVERIEVLKDGASAIYGADAVGGVVNIIMKSDYAGLEIGASAGTSQYHDGNSLGFNLTAGMGSLAGDRYNVLVGVNLAKRDEIRSIDRWWARTEDLRDRGGLDRRSSYGTPGTITDLTTGDALFNVGGTCGPTSQHGGSSVRAGFCRYDRPTLGSLIPESQKTGIFSKAQFAVTPDITAFGELLFTRNRFRSHSWPAGTTDDVGIGTNTIPAGAPNNPFPNDADIRYRFSDVGNRGDDGKTDTTRLVVGAKGTTLGWDWEGAASFNRVNIDTKAMSNALNSRLMCLMNPTAAASYAAGGDPLGLGTLAQIFAANPAYGDYFRAELAKCGAAFAQFGYYNFVNPSANAPGTAAYLKHDSTRTGRSKLDGFDIRASRELTKLAGGPLAIAVGAETRKEKVSDTPDIQLQTGDTLAISAAQAFGERRASAVFTELSAPFLKELEASLALRYDKYSGNGDFSATSPKIGLRYQPMKELVVRSTASRAFRAPSLFETTPAQQTSFNFGIQDPILCPDINQAATNPNCALDLRTVQQGNPNLKAETSTMFTFGLVLAPDPAVGITIDYWKVKRKDEIGTFAPQDLVNLFPNDPTIVVRNAAGVITQINTVPVQLNGTRTSGVDMELVLRQQLGSLGRLTTKLGATVVTKYLFTTVDSNRNQVLVNYNGTYNQPRFRSTWDFSLESGSWEYSLGGYSIGRYEGLGTTASVAPEVVWNGGISYKGIKNLSIRFHVANLLNRRPSFDDESSGSNAGYNPQLGEPIGRFYTLGAQYKF